MFLKKPLEAAVDMAAEMLDTLDRKLNPRPKRKFRKRPHRKNARRKKRVRKRK